MALVTPFSKAQAAQAALVVAVAAVVVTAHHCLAIGARTAVAVKAETERQRGRIDLVACMGQVHLFRLNLLDLVALAHHTKIKAQTHIVLTGNFPGITVSVVWLVLMVRLVQMDMQSMVFHI
jgi:hypothetical protein